MDPDTLKSNENFARLLEEILEYPVEIISLPYSENILHLVAKVSAYHSNLLQNIVAFRSNYFQVQVFAEKLLWQKSVSQKSDKIPEAHLARILMAFESCQVLGFDFVDFGKICCDHHGNWKFSLRLTPESDSTFPSLPACLNSKEVRIDPDNYRQVLAKLVVQMPQIADPYFLYHIDDFSTKILNSMPFVSPKKPVHIKIKIAATDDCQKKFIKINLLNQFYSDEVLFINIPKSTKNFVHYLQKFLNLDSSKSHYAGILTSLLTFLKQSTFYSMILMIDQVNSLEEVEFFENLLEGAEAVSVILLYFGDNSPFQFNWVLKENPGNYAEQIFSTFLSKGGKENVLQQEELRLLRIVHCLAAFLTTQNTAKIFTTKELQILQYLEKSHWLQRNDRGLLVPNNLLTPEALSISESEEYDILSLYAKNLAYRPLSLYSALKGQQLGDAKRQLECYLQNGSATDMDQEALHSVLQENLKLLAEHPDLLALCVEVFFKDGRFDLAEELCVRYRQKNEFMFAIKQAHLFKIKKEYVAMAKILKELAGGSPPDGLKDEWNYLNFFLAERQANHKTAKQFLKQIKGRHFLNLANINLIDQHIYNKAYARANELMAKSRLYFSEKNHPVQVLEIDSLQAKIMRESGEFTKAEQLYKNLFIASETKNFVLTSAHTAIDLGNLFWHQDDFAKAEFWYHRALGIYRRISNKSGEMLAQSNLMETKKITGDWQEINNYLLMILRYDRENNKIHSLGVDYYNLAHLEYLRHNFNKSLKLLELAKPIFRSYNNLAYLLECELLAGKILFFFQGKVSDWSFLRSNRKQLNHDQKIQLQMMDLCAQKLAANDFVALTKMLEQIQLKTIQFEMTGLLLVKFQRSEWLDSLKIASIQLSKGTKNFFYFEYHFVCCNLLADTKILMGQDRSSFLDMYYFFVKNKRKLPVKIHKIKKHLAEQDAHYDVFKNAQLVQDYRHWTIPNDFFQQLVRELNAKMKPEIVQLKIFEQGEVIFHFQTSSEFGQLREEIINRGWHSSKNGHFQLADIQQDFTCPEKVFYPYQSTQVVIWRISSSLSGIMLLAFLEAFHFPPDIIHEENGLFKNLASLFTQFYENHFQLNKKLSFLIGESPAMKSLKKLIAKVSKVDFPVLLTGESGSGKELVAKSIHLLSNRCNQPFVPVNAAAIPENMLEAELFGYRKGAFTGATESKMGLIESAAGGTLFLDEIADLPLNLQAKLLRVLQESEIRRLGENKINQVNFRLISATNQDLRLLAQQKKFRDDLFFRMEVLAVAVPPLRDRIEDIPLLVEHFFKQNKFVFANQIEMVSFIADLKNQEWPGNIRQLESHIKRTITFYPDGDITSNSSSANKFSFNQAKEDFEKSLLIKALNDNNWNKVKTAQVLQISRVHLFNLIRKYQLERP